MDKRIAANLRVKHKIIEALLALMEEKNFSEISVTDIVARAGVARQSYYRNFASREAIIEAFFDELHGEALQAAAEQQIQYPSEQSIALVFSVVKERRQALLTLHRSGFSEYTLETINQMVEFLLGDMPASSIERYQIYMFSGAIYNTAMAWLVQGAVESCEDMARVVYAFKTADLVAPRAPAAQA